MPAPAHLKLTLHGYIPISRNSLKGAHWGTEFREKKRAFIYLRRAIASLSPATPVTLWTGTTTPELSNAKTLLCRLDSYPATHGTSWKALSFPGKHTTNKTNEPK